MDNKACRLNYRRLFFFSEKVTHANAFLNGLPGNEEPLSKPLLENKHREDTEESDRQCDPLLANNQSNNKDSDNDASQMNRRHSSESYHASSHLTENTDSVTGGFGLSNRVSRFISLETGT